MLSVIGAIRSNQIGEEKIEQQAEVSDSQRARADHHLLADYFSQMRSLIFSNGLIESPRNPDAEIIAKALTQNVMQAVGSEQNKEVAAFLREFGLIQAGVVYDGEPYTLSSRPTLLSLLYSVNLSGAQLSSVQLSLANLASADFSHSNLQGAFLGVTDLTYANFSNADLTGTDLNGANLKNARFVEAQLVNTIMGQSTLSEADFSSANIVNTTVARESDLQNAKFTNASLSAAYFFGSDLSNTDFSGTTMRVVGFVESDLSNANLSGIQPDDTFERTRYFASIDLTDAILTNTDFRGTDLRKAKVSEAQLAPSLLCNTRLPKGFSIDPDKDCAE